MKWKKQKVNKKYLVKHLVIQEHSGDFEYSEKYSVNRAYHDIQMDSRVGFKKKISITERTYVGKPTLTYYHFVIR